MNSGAVFAGVETEADSGVGVVGKFGAPVEVDGCIRLAGGDDLDSASVQKGTEADVEGEVGGFLKLATIEVGTDILATVRCVEDDNEARGGGRGCLGCRRTRGSLLRHAAEREGQAEQKFHRDL
jgi:hypothetical protein